MTERAHRSAAELVASETRRRAPDRLERSGAADGTAADEERTRRIRDLHDAATQAVFAAAITAEVLPRLLEHDPAAGRRAAKELVRLARAARDAVRALGAAERSGAGTPTEPADWSRARAGWPARRPAPRR